MRKIKTLSSAIFIFACIFVTAQSRDIEYVQKYALLAVQEMELYKIPASITLAQGILETGGGQSRLAEEANNHFGIKCKAEWTGDKIYHDDDHLGECFRKYKDVKGSFRDHSKFLAERHYYKDLFMLEPTDYKAWAHGLKKAGYATNPRYAYILIDKIEKLNLHEFDKIKTDQVYDQVVSLYGPVDRRVVDPDYRAPKPTILAKAEPKNVKKQKKEPKKKQEKDTPARVLSAKERLKEHPNKRDYIIVQAGETIHKIAEMFHESEKKLLEYNELENPRDLKAGQYFFFKRKRNWSNSKYHTVKEGETMYLISQKHAMKLSKLYYKNRMEKGQEPRPGDVLYLRGRKPRK